MGPAVLPGAEAWSVAGGRCGALVVHGFTGSPATMRPVAGALVEAGFTVSAPRLPGHGTTIDDMVTTRFSDWLAARHRHIDGIVCINPLVEPAEPALVELVQLMLDAGETVGQGVGADLADPEASEIAYDGSPLAPALSLYLALDELQADLPGIACPVLIMTSTEDHVVHPHNSDHLAGLVSGPVERVTLARSYHVATLDHDREEVAARTVAFMQRVTA